MPQSNKMPLVLIPGLACTVDLFMAQHRNLSQNRNVIIPDHTRHDSMEKIAASILADAPERFALAGLSMGGYISFEIIRQAPERVARLCLMDTSARADTQEKTVLRQDALALVAKGKYISVCRSTLDLSIAKSRHSDRDLKTAILKMAQDTGPAAWARQTKAIMNRADSVPFLKAITCPTMVIIGDEDNLTPMGCAVEMAQGIAKTQLEIVADCGHMSSMERPQEITNLLQKWLEM